MRKLGLALALGLLSASLFAQDLDKKLTDQMGIDQKMGAWVPQDAQFKDESGKTVKFKTRYFAPKGTDSVSVVVNKATGDLAQAK